MKNENMTEVLRIHISPAQKEAVIESARSNGMKISEYIRSLVFTHRASFAMGDNEFLIEQPDGSIYSTELERTVTSPGYAEAILQHARNGYHPECVICQQKARDPRTPAERELDDHHEAYDETIKSVRPY